MYSKMTDQVTAPQTLDEVEDLVKRLYQPGSPQLLHSIQAQLQTLQRSGDGWQLADKLLASDDKNVRFFGALTFQVKLNNDGSRLDPDTAQQVLGRLIYWLVTLNQQGEAPFVQKKLCSTLTTYFLQSPVSWESPIHQLAASLHHGEVQVQGIRNADFEVIVATLTGQQLLVLLWFASTLAEELSRIDNVNAKSIRFHDQMESILPSVSRLMGYGFQQKVSPIQAGSLSCFSSWVNYAQPMWPTKPDAINLLRELIEPALECSLNTATETEALGILRDLLESYTSFFQPYHMEIIANLLEQHFGPNLRKAIKDQDSDATMLVQLLVAYSIADIKRIVEEPESPSSNMVMGLHFEILQTDSFPGEEHDPSLTVVEFWNTYIEYIIDTVYSDQSERKPDWTGLSRNVLLQVNRFIWKKMWPPPIEITKNWTSDERTFFKEFRQDAAEILSSNFVLLGRDMVQQLIEVTLQSLKARHWQAVEAGLCCLKALADNIMEDASNDDLLALLFGSSLFRDIADSGQTISAQARKTAVDVLGEYGSYIERHPEYLPDALRFLFMSLENTALANTAARSITSLCEWCRQSLTDQLGDFLQQYQRFMAGPTNTPDNQEKVIGAIAAIVQAVYPESKKGPPLHALLDNVEMQIAKARKSASEGNFEDAEYIGAGALSSLARIGKSMQVPTDGPINLDDEETAQNPPNVDFWETADGKAIQGRIVNALGLVHILNHSGDAISAACQVLRSGFTETAPGPFVLPASVTVDFLQQFPVETPQLEEILSTSGTLIVQHSNSTSRRIDSEVTAILEKSVSFIVALPVPANDPSIAHGCIDVFERMLPAYSNVLFALPLDKLQFLLDFTIASLSGTDPLPKRSACEFWAKVMNLLGPQRTIQAHNTRAQVEQIIQVFGLKLARALMSQISGEASRSDLDDLCKPLKTMVFHVPQCKGLLEAAVFNRTQDSPPSRGLASDVDKRRFIDQIVTDRRGNKTREIVRAFWIGSRGTINFGT